MFKKKYSELTVGEVLGYSFGIGGFVLVLEWIVMCTNWLEKAFQFAVRIGERLSFKK